jgi:hypothetical protein
LAVANDSPLADATNSPLQIPTEIPRIETAEGTGAVTGYLVLRTAEGDKPVVDVKIGLAEVMTDSLGREAVIGYDNIGAPADVTDANGFFAIADVPPGRWGFILDTVWSSYMLRTPGVDEDMLITVEPGGQNDMGVLWYENLPLPPEE